MKAQSLDQAIIEAVRFLKVAKRLRAGKKREQAAKGLPVRLPKESAAVRRASMDLTRSLADLRQGR